MSPHRPRHRAALRVPLFAATLALSLGLLPRAAAASPPPQGPTHATYERALRDEMVRRLPGDLADALSLAVRTLPGAPDEASPGRAAHRILDASATLRGESPFHAAGRGDLHLEPGSGDFAADLDLTAVDLSAHPLFAALAARVDLPGLVRSPLRGRARLERIGDRIAASFDLTDGPRHLAGRLERTGGILAGKIRIAWRMRTLPASARFPHALETVLDRREVNFLVERRDGRWHIESPEEQSLLAAAANLPMAAAGRFEPALARGSANPALALAAAAAALPAGFAPLHPAMPRDAQAVTLERLAAQSPAGGEAARVPFVPFVEVAARSEDLPLAATLPPAVATPLRFGIPDLIPAVAFTALSAPERLVVAWSRHRFAARRPASPERDAALVRHGREASLALREALVARNQRAALADPETRRERAALLAFAARLAAATAAPAAADSHEPLAGSRNGR